MVKWDPSKVLFVGAGSGSSPVFYYRCMLPATVLKCSYGSFVGDWPKVRWTTGLVRGPDADAPLDSKIPAFENYDIIIMQQPHTQGWLDLIKALQRNGKKVVFEVDDYLHGIAGKRDHDYRKFFTAKYLARYERCMRAADAMIVSTPFIAEHYARFNRNIHVCLNGLDTGRYNLQRPSRKTINVGWAGATGHIDAIVPWLQPLANVMGQNPDTTFITIGQNFAQAFKPAFGNRALCIPFASIEQYPGAMTMFDIALAPAGNGTWYRGKSDLRFLEAGALGVPVIADPHVYPFIEHGVTGFHATSPMHMESMLNILVRDVEQRERVGAAAKKYVWEQRSIQAMAPQWIKACEEIANA